MNYVSCQKFFGGDFRSDFYQNGCSEHRFEISPPGNCLNILTEWENVQVFASVLIVWTCAYFLEIV